MVRKKTRRVVYRYVKPRRTSRRNTGGITRDLIGMGGYVLAEGLIDNLLAKTNLNLPSNVVETGLGYYLKGRKGTLGAIGKVMFYINAYQLVKQMLGNINIGNIFSNLTTQQTQQNNNNSNSVWD